MSPTADIPKMLGNTGFQDNANRRQSRDRRERHRHQLKGKGIHRSWEWLRQQLRSRTRITVTMNTRENKTIHVRKSTRAEPHQQIIYNALGISSQIGVSQRTTVEPKKEKNL
ncbi:MAG: hypothetical protein HQL48_04930 [Gammaproteobacteria bacterium]|nr:hypothetical protein [Gammaproteobacteria bacterium]